MNGVFEGVHGAISLSLIAFSIVFLVLLGLTAVIFAIRFFASVVNQQKKTMKAAPKKETVKSPATQPQATAGTAEEVVAAITGALVARIGKGFRIVSIKAQSENLANDPWKGWGRMEAMQGMDRSNWNGGTWN